LLFTKRCWERCTRSCGSKGELYVPLSSCAGANPLPRSGSPPYSDLSGRSHGLALPITHSHHAKILFHASPLAQLLPEWTKEAQGGFKAGEGLDRLLALEGVASLKVSLLKPQKDVVPLADYIDEGQTSRPRYAHPLSSLSVLTFGSALITASSARSALPSTSPSFELYQSKSAQWPHFTATSSTTSPTFLAHFSPGVPITKATGRRIMAALGRGEEHSQAFGSSASRKLSAETTWIEDLLVSWHISASRVSTLTGFRLAGIATRQLIGQILV